jgi:hypothetical protein
MVTAIPTETNGIVLLVIDIDLGRADGIRIIGGDLIATYNLYSVIAAVYAHAVIMIDEAGEYLNVPQDIIGNQADGEFPVTVALSRPARDGANLFLNGKCQLRQRMTLNELRFAYKLLDNAPNHPSIFPRGKWTTLQVIKSIIVDNTERVRRENSL